MEETVGEPGPPVEASQGGGVAPLHQGDEDDPGHDEDGARCDGELGVQGPAFTPAQAPPQFDDDGEADAAEDHRQGDGQQDERVPGEARHAVVVQGQARVVERGDRVEQPRVRGLERVHVVGEPHARGDHQEHAGLNDQEDDRHTANQPADLADPQTSRLGLHVELHTQPETVDDRRAEDRGQGHDAHTADLHQHHEHHLAEDAQIVPHGDHAQSAHGKGRGRGEQRGDEVQPPTVRGGDREHEQEGAGQVHHEEDGEEHPGRLAPGADLTLGDPGFGGVKAPAPSSDGPGQAPPPPCQGPFPGLVHRAFVSAQASSYAISACTSSHTDPVNCAKERERSHLSAE